MLNRFQHPIRALCFLALGLVSAIKPAFAATSWTGALRDDAGIPVGGATVNLHSTSASRDYTVTTSTTGEFTFPEIPADSDAVSVNAAGSTWQMPNPLVIRDGTTLSAALQLSPHQKLHLWVVTAGKASSPQASGGEHL